MGFLKSRKVRLSLTGSHFENNIGGYHVVVIATWSTIYLQNVVMKENGNRDHGGLLRATSSSVEIIDSTVQNNHCINTLFDIRSEIIASYNSDYILVKNCTFQNNVANGSLILADNLHEMAIQDSTFMGEMHFLIIADGVPEIRIAGSTFRASGSTKEAHLKITPSESFLLTDKLNITSDNITNPVHEFSGWLYPVTSGTLTERETVFASGE